MKDIATERAKSDLSEPEAIRRAQGGDAAAFEHLYKTHSRRVYSVCLRMLKNATDAEDLTQQVFLRLFRKIGTFRGESGFSTWLHRVTVNAVLMHLRRKRPIECLADCSHQVGTDSEDARDPVSSDTLVLGAIDRLNLIRAIRKLPVGYKRIFLLHDVMGYEHSEIGKLVGCSIGCSKSQTHKARKRLRNLLQGKRWQGEPDALSA